MYNHPKLTREYFKMHDENRFKRLSKKANLPVFLFCLFFGLIGAHRFYVGKHITGILQLITLGGFGVWALIDFIVIIMSRFEDADGAVIELWVIPQSTSADIASHRD